MATSRYFSKVSVTRGRAVATNTAEVNVDKLENGESDGSRAISMNIKRRRVAQETAGSSSAASSSNVINEAKAIRLKPSTLPEGMPFCAPPPAKYRCRVKSTCVDCFLGSADCIHMKETPLDLLLLGHNPSSHVWAHGYSYGQPSNKMWSLLTGDFPLKNAFKGCLPSGVPIELQNELPHSYGIGFTDIALVPGSDAASFSDAFMRSWVPNFFARLRSHVQRVRESADPNYTGPKIVAFTGKRQFLMMYSSKAQEPKETINFGRVSHDLLPDTWPFPESTQVWVLTSSSGRAAMTNEQRAEPYIKLAEEYHRIRRNNK